NVADIVAVVGPVHTELEFHGDAGRHAHGEVDAEEHAPELRHLPPDLAAGHDVDAFHDAEEERQTERQWHEEEVIHGRQAELQPRELYDIHFHRLQGPVREEVSAGAASNSV